MTLRSDHPEIQAKIRRVIEQGHIDAEDFNGVSDVTICLRCSAELKPANQDPEYNVLGQSGIRGRARKTEPDEENGEVCLLDGATNLGFPVAFTHDNLRTLLITALRLRRRLPSVVARRPPMTMMRRKSTSSLPRRRPSAPRRPLPRRRRRLSRMRKTPRTSRL